MSINETIPLTRKRQGRLSDLKESPEEPLVDLANQARLYQITDCCKASWWMAALNRMPISCCMVCGKVIDGEPR